MATGILTGKIVKWMDNKGFGFITPNKGDKQIFVHISSFDRDASRKPRVGDTVYYYLSEDKSGRPCAASVRIAGVEPIQQKPLSSPTKPKHAVKPNRQSGKFSALGLCVFIAIFSFAYSEFSKNNPTQTQRQQVVSPAQQPLPEPIFQESFSNPTYTCKGKTGCHQMNSCEEANFYLRNCPGTKMDGDNDGRPCERGPC